MGAGGRKTCETGSCSHQRPILQSQLSSAHHCPPPFSVSLSCFLFTSEALNLSFLSLLHFSSWYPGLVSLHPPSILSSALQRDWKPRWMEGKAGAKEHPSYIRVVPHPPPSLSVPSLVHSPLLLSSPWLVAARIGALLHALRWRAHTVGLLQLNWARWRAAERADSSLREGREVGGDPLCHHLRALWKEGIGLSAHQMGHSTRAVLAAIWVCFFLHCVLCSKAFDWLLIWIPVESGWLGFKCEGAWMAIEMLMQSTWALGHRAL